MLFYDRKEAGRSLAAELIQFKGKKDVLILGLARGGVVVAFEVAKELDLPLNVITPRKIGAPGNPELALGSITEEGVGVFNPSIIRYLGVPQSFIDQEIEKEKALARKRLSLYRQYAPLPEIKNHVVVLVDDGIATGSTMLTCVKAMRHAGAKSVIVAAPVASTDAHQLVSESADEVICPNVREDFGAVGMFYRVFGQTEDEEVVALLKEAAKMKKSAVRKENETVHISIESDKILEGELSIPEGAKGIVLFAHGSGSSRFSPRNQFVAKALREKKLGTFLIDLLTAEEEEFDELTRALRFDIDLLANRLLEVTRWMLKDSRTQSLHIGYFGSSTGAAAALIAAAKKPKSISAVVSRGGRPDLAKDFLSEVKAPTLLIVGGADTVVIELNQEAFDLLSATKKLEIVPHATHLFEEPGALEKVAELAGLWFQKYLSQSLS